MRRAFTLIEALAVVAILALVAATLAVSLGSTAQAAAWQRAQSEVRHFDRMVRLEARAHGPIEIAVDGDGASLIATRDGGRGYVLRSTPFAPGSADGLGLALMAVDHRAPGVVRELKALTSVQIDAAGRSIDFTYQLSEGSESLRLHAAGLTGHLRGERE